VTNLGAFQGGLCHPQSPSRWPTTHWRKLILLKDLFNHKMPDFHEFIMHKDKTKWNSDPGDEE
jgi:hypothetical protein